MRTSIQSAERSRTLAAAAATRVGRVRLSPRASADSSVTDRGGPLGAAKRMAMNCDEVGWKRPLAEPSSASRRRTIPHAVDPRSLARTEGLDPHTREAGRITAVNGDGDRLQMGEFAEPAGWSTPQFGPHESQRLKRPC
jgi:hypothetical protein